MSQRDVIDLAQRRSDSISTIPSPQPTEVEIRDVAEITGLVEGIQCILERHRHCGDDCAAKWAVHMMDALINDEIPDRDHREVYACL